MYLIVAGFAGCQSSVFTVMAWLIVLGLNEAGCSLHLKIASRRGGDFKVALIAASALMAA